MKVTMNEIPSSMLAGFDIAGYMQPDGSIKSATLKEHVLKAIPTEIKFKGNTYTYEYAQAGKLDPEKGQWVNLIYV